MGSYWTSIQNSARRQKLDALVGKVKQFVSQNVKTNRKVNYDQEDKSYNKIEMLLSIGNSLFLYHNTRSKKLVDFISDLSIGVNYDKVISMKKNIASYIQEQRDQNNGVFIRTGFVPRKTTFFAIESGDVKIDTPDGKKQLHSTVIAAYQEKQSIMNGETTVSHYADEHVFFFLETEIFFKRCQKVGLKGNPSYEYFEPPNNNFQYFDYREKIQFTSLDEFRTQDTVQTLLKTLCIFNCGWRFQHGLHIIL